MACSCAATTSSRSLMCSSKAWIFRTIQMKNSRSLTGRRGGMSGQSLGARLVERVGGEVVGLRPGRGVGVVDGRARGGRHLGGRAVAPVDDAQAELVRDGEPEHLAG